MFSWPSPRPRLEALRCRILRLRFYRDPLSFPTPVRSSLSPVRNRVATTRILSHSNYRLRWLTRARAPPRRVNFRPLRVFDAFEILTPLVQLLRTNDSRANRTAGDQLAEPAQRVVNADPPTRITDNRNDHDRVRSNIASRLRFCTPDPRARSDDR